MQSKPYPLCKASLPGWLTDVPEYWDVMDWVQKKIVSMLKEVA